MRPAFSSIRQALAFAALLLVLMLGPLLAGKRLLPPRAEIYSSIWWASGEFPYLDQQLYHEKGDIDILIIGSSHIWAAFDTPFIQDQLTRQLGRPAVVRSLCWGGEGFDATYLITKDILQQRTVKLLVTDDNYRKSGTPHPLAPRLFRFGDDAQTIRDLSLATKAAYYFGSVVGLPRNLLSFCRSNLPGELHSGKKNYQEIYFNAINPADRLGALTARMGFRKDGLSDSEPFHEHSPHTDALPSDVCRYSEASKSAFTFAMDRLPQTQLHFATAFAELARQQKCRLVMLHVPSYDERKSPVISEPAFWPESLHADITMLGIPPAILFSKLGDTEIRQLYCDPVHLNQNGQSYFTRLITPELLTIYRDQIAH